MTDQPAAATRPARLDAIEQVMERLGVGRSCVFELIGSGQLRSVKIGRRRLVADQAIDDYIVEGRSTDSRFVQCSLQFQKIRTINGSIKHA